MADLAALLDTIPAPLSTVAALERLVAFDTTSCNSNLDLISWVRAYLDGLDVPYRLSFDPTGQKANLHAIVGPQVAGGIALSGHTDVVPVDGQAWSGDPFRLRRESGRLIGRGTADMKGFVAACLAAVPGFQAAGLARPVHLLLSYDEEVSCDGARRLIEDFADGGLAPSLCIVGEPSGMQPILAHKGRLAVQVTARGRTGHSSAPGRGVNAVSAAAEAVVWVAAEARRFAVDGPFAEGFDPPHTTVHVGTLHGGTILNIIPEFARFVMEWRVIPGSDAAAELGRMHAHVAAILEPAMHAVDPSTGFEFEALNWLPGLSLDPHHPLATLVCQLTGSNSAGHVSYGTEAGLFEQAGIPSIVCGPGHIAQAHQADEWIAESELAACDAFLRRLTLRLAAS